LHVRKSIESLLSGRNSEKLIVNIIPERDTIGGNDKENEHKNIEKAEIFIENEVSEKTTPVPIILEQNISK